MGTSTAFRSRARTRGWLALLAALVLVPVAGAGALGDHRREQATVDHVLAAEASEQAGNLAASFERARSLTALLGRNPSFSEFYALPGRRAQRIRRGGLVVSEIQQALADLEKLFPHMIGEACFIDSHGPENARAVSGRVAPRAQLSRDESANIFFKPAFALRPGEVLQPRPYISPDTRNWVVANATPIRRGGVNRAIVHFELSLTSLQRTLAASSDRAHVQVVEAGSGDVVVDSEHRPTAGTVMQPATDARVRDIARNPGAGGVLSRDGDRIGYAHVARAAHNANDWIVVALPRTTGGSWLAAVTAGHMALLLAALALLGYGVALLRYSHRTLATAALTDELTGLPNRRRLMHDLSEQASAASDSAPVVLALFDLDGFKQYNDSFGHAAGDSLLARLGERLAAATRGRATAYRLGGDEFCVLARIRSAADAIVLVEEATDALSERGEGFLVGCSSGTALLPVDSCDGERALALADERMYARKAANPRSASSQSSSVLLKLLAERDQRLGDHVGEVAGLAAAVARRLGLDGEHADEIERAAALHDIGKAAIPDAILLKAGPLDAEEWDFMSRHTIIGERILLAAPALASVAVIVRSSHERLDGGGYPDGLAGDQIPLGARIIAVCDAYDAMTAERPYRAPMTSAQAVAELRRCASSQFDPVVVEAFCEELAAAAALGHMFDPRTIAR
jgi:diguanylate cyclase (GGDEF)-like protein